MDHQCPSRRPLHLEHVHANPSPHPYPPGPIHKGSLEVSFLRPQQENQRKIPEESASLYSEEKMHNKEAISKTASPQLFEYQEKQNIDNVILTFYSIAYHFATIGISL